MFSVEAPREGVTCSVCSACFMRCMGLFVHREPTDESGAHFIKNVVICLILGGLLMFFGVAAPV